MLLLNRDQSLGKAGLEKGTIYVNDLYVYMEPIEIPNMQ